MTAQVDQNSIRHVAKLANLSLSEEEVLTLQEQLGNILAHIGEIKQCAESLSPRPEVVLGEVARERPDRVFKSLSVEVALSQAPAKSGTAFLVPRIIDIEA